MISDEAVAAAVPVILRGIDEGHHAYKIAYAALEAAAPHMLAEAWDDGMIYGTRGQHRYQEDFDTNPYRSQA